MTISANRWPLLSQAGGLCASQAVQVWQTRRKHLVQPTNQRNCAFLATALSTRKSRKEALVFCEHGLCEIECGCLCLQELARCDRDGRPNIVVPCDAGDVGSFHPAGHGEAPLMHLPPGRLCPPVCSSKVPLPMQV